MRTERIEACRVRAGRLGLRLLGLCCAVLGGCAGMATDASYAPVPDAAAGTGASAEYVIGVPDLLQVTVWQQPDLSGPLLVRRDGRISVPLLGDVTAAGLTPRQLARELEAGLGRFVTEPRVDVAVTEMRSQVVSVIGGGVVRSGVIELRHDMRIIDALAEMGGLTEFARKRDIRVLRKTDAGEVTYRFDYQAFIDGEAPQSNFPLEPGDTIVVAE